MDCDLPVKDHKSKTFSIRDENLGMFYMHLRELTQFFKIVSRDATILQGVTKAFAAQFFSFCPPHVKQAAISSPSRGRPASPGTSRRAEQN